MLKTGSSICHGFFSCSNMRFHNLVYFWNRHRTVPISIDDSDLFKLYKSPLREKESIANDFFTTREEIQIDSSENLQILNGTTEDQFTPYSYLRFNDTQQFIKRYFTPSQRIMHLQSALLTKYRINPPTTCAIYYRGTDKHTETKLGSFDMYAAKMSELLLTNPSIEFILQSDSYPFVEYIFQYADTHKIQNNIIAFEENVTTNTDHGVHFLRQGEKAYEDISHLFASVVLMAQCKYIICSSSNVSLWMMYYRGHTNNVHQLLNNQWYR